MIPMIIAIAAVVAFFWNVSLIHFQLDTRLVALVVRFRVARILFAAWMAVSIADWLLKSFAGRGFLVDGMNEAALLIWQLAEVVFKLKNRKAQRSPACDGATRATHED